MINVVFIVTLIRLLIVTGRPFLCSGIYSILVLFYCLVTKMPPLDLSLHTGIALALGSLYFWLLDRLEGRIFLFWTVAAVGLVIGFV